MRPDLIESETAGGNSDGEKAGDNCLREGQQSKGETDMASRKSASEREQNCRRDGDVGKRREEEAVQSNEWQGI